MNFSNLEREYGLAYTLDFHDGVRWRCLKGITLEDLPKLIAGKQLWNLTVNAVKRRKPPQNDPIVALVRKLNLKK